MNTKDYRRRLDTFISCLPEEEREEAISFYTETIADRMDEGATETEAVASIASPEEAAMAILSAKISEMGGPNERTLEDTLILEGLVDAYDELASDDVSAEKSRGFLERLKDRHLSPLEWVAIILTSPLWLSLLVTASALALALVIVVFAIYLVAWTLIGCVWVVGGAFVVSSPCALLFALWGMQIGNGPYALVNAGYTLFLFGAGVWILRGAYALTRAFLVWQRKNIVIKVEGFGRSRRAKGINIDAEREEPADAQGAAPSLESQPDSVETAEQHAEESASQRTWQMLFKVCLFLLAGGIACVLVAFIASGFDWRIFITSLYTEGNVYLGGMLVATPERLLFSPYWFLGR